MVLRQNAVRKKIESELMGMGRPFHYPNNRFIDLIDDIATRIQVEAASDGGDLSEGYIVVRVIGKSLDGRSYVGSGLGSHEQTHEFRLHENAIAHAQNGVWQYTALPLEAMANIEVCACALNLGYGRRSGDLPAEFVSKEMKLSGDRRGAVAFDVSLINKIDADGDIERTCAFFRIYASVIGRTGDTNERYATEKTQAALYNWATMQRKRSDLCGVMIEGPDEARAFVYG